MVFAAVMFGSAVPVVLDGLRATSVGSLVLVAAWLVAALALWWPVLRRRGRQLRYMAAVAYLFVPFILPKIPGLVYIVADEPLYRVYAAAPRVAGLAFPAGIDQRAAGAVLWSAGTVMVFVSLGVLFAAWYGDERRASAPASLEIPADPELVAELFAIPGAWMALERVIGHLQASLPPGTTGYDLRLAVREHGMGRRVVAELHAPLSDDGSAEVSRIMQQDFDHYLARMTPAQRALIEGQLGFEVVPFRTRAT
ncbi:MAG: cytochrome c oxidase assembly protein [Dehalococcoidia bacterium]